ncbi:uncharacterized protein [Centruroides vittatus]|uniref:uncharacterized protein n=1 Tax=Centruroides vittatus TaxID=120091 RepID=UPI00350F537B
MTSVSGELPSRIIQKGFIVKAYVEDALYLDTQITFFYTSGIRRFAFSELLTISSIVNIEETFIQVVWFCILITFPLTLIITYGVINKTFEIKRMEKLTVSELKWIFIRHLLRQDTSIDHITNFTFRIIIGCWILTTFVLTSGYLGILPSFMINPGSESIPQNFMELTQAIKQGRYNVTVFWDTEEIRIFHVLKPAGRLTEKDETIRTISDNIYMNLPESRKWHGATSPIYKLLNGTEAIIGPKYILESIMMQWGKKNFYLSPDTIYTNFRYVRFHLVKFNHVEEVVRIIAILQQSGIQAKIQADIQEENRRYYEFNAENNDNEEIFLKFEDLASVFYVLFAGYAICLAVFLAEIAIVKLSKVKCKTIVHS